MTNIDQFESVFKSAEKTLFEFEPVTIRSALLITDQDADAAQEYLERVQSFLAVLHQHQEQEVDWTLVDGSGFGSVGSVLQRVGEHEPDLICTHRNLRIPATEYPYSLGVYLDVLTQATTIPVLVMPHPVLLQKRQVSLDAPSTVMAITDHLSGDHHLVSFALYMTIEGGKLWLTHVEDAATFQRYTDAIARIPAIDTDSAHDHILKQLLKEPKEYIASCRDGLEQTGCHAEILEEVALGRLLTDYRRLIDEHQVSLLVMNTKDSDQLAMHGMAYPLTVELRETPLLLL